MRDGLGGGGDGGGSIYGRGEESWCVGGRSGIIVAMVF